MEDPDDDPAINLSKPEVSANKLGDHRSPSPEAKDGVKEESEGDVTSIESAAEGTVSNCFEDASLEENPSTPLECGKLSTEGPSRENSESYQLGESSTDQHTSEYLEEPLSQNLQNDEDLSREAWLSEGLLEKALQTECASVALRDDMLECCGGTKALDGESSAQSKEQSYLAEKENDPLDTETSKSLNAEFLAAESGIVSTEGSLSDNEGEPQPMEGGCKLTTPDTKDNAAASTSEESCMNTVGSYREEDSIVQISQSQNEISPQDASLNQYVEEASPLAEASIESDEAKEVSDPSEHDNCMIEEDNGHLKEHRESNSPVDETSCNQVEPRRTTTDEKSDQVIEDELCLVNPESNSTIEEFTSHQNTTLEEADSNGDVDSLVEEDLLPSKEYSKVSSPLDQHSSQQDEAIAKLDLTENDDCIIEEDFCSNINAMDVQVQLDDQALREQEMTAQVADESHCKDDKQNRQSPIDSESFNHDDLSKSSTEDLNGISKNSASSMDKATHSDSTTHEKEDTLNSHQVSRAESPYEDEASDAASINSYDLPREGSRSPAESFKKVLRKDTFIAKKKAKGKLQVSIINDNDLLLIEDIFSIKPKHLEKGKTSHSAFQKGQPMYAKKKVTQTAKSDDSFDNSLPRPSSRISNISSSHDEYTSEAIPHVFNGTQSTETERIDDHQEDSAQSLKRKGHPKKQKLALESVTSSLEQSVPKLKNLKVSLNRESVGGLLSISKPTNIENEENKMSNDELSTKLDTCDLISDKQLQQLYPDVKIHQKDDPQTAGTGDSLPMPIATGKRRPKVNGSMNDIQTQCCGHWFPNKKHYIRHLVVNSIGKSDIMHQSKLLEEGMVKCTKCQSWKTSSLMSKHLKIAHGITLRKSNASSLSIKIKNIKGSTDVNTSSPDSEVKENLTDFADGQKMLEEKKDAANYRNLAPKPGPKSSKPCPKSKKMSRSKQVTCYLEGDSKAKVSRASIKSIYDLPPHYRPHVRLSPIPKADNLTYSRKFSNRCATKREDAMGLDSCDDASPSIELGDISVTGQPDLFSMSLNVDLPDDDEDGSRPQKLKKKVKRGQKEKSSLMKKPMPLHEKNNNIKVSNNAVSINKLKQRNGDENSKNEKFHKHRRKSRYSIDDSYVPDMGNKIKPKKRGRPSLLSRKLLETSDGESLSSDTDESVESDDSLKENVENIPTVELDLYTLPSFDEEVSVFLRDSQNPDLKVFASMDAIFVGDSASGNKANQISYMVNSGNVVFVDPGHFLFPEVDLNGSKKKLSREKGDTNYSEAPSTKRISDQVSKKKLKDTKYDKENQHGKSMTDSSFVLTTMPSGISDPIANDPYDDKQMKQEDDDLDQDYFSILDDEDTAINQSLKDGPKIDGVRKIKNSLKPHLMSVKKLPPYSAKNISGKENSLKSNSQANDSSKLDRNMKKILTNIPHVSTGTKQDLKSIKRKKKPSNAIYMKGSTKSTVLLNSGKEYSNSSILSKDPSPKDLETATKTDSLEITECEISDLVGDPPFTKSGISKKALLSEAECYQDRRKFPKGPVTIKKNSANSKPKVHIVKVIPKNIKKKAQQIKANSSKGSEVPLIQINYYSGKLSSKNSENSNYRQSDAVKPVKTIVVRTGSQGTLSDRSFLPKTEVLKSHKKMKGVSIEISKSLPTQSNPKNALPPALSDKAKSNVSHSENAPLSSVEENQFNMLSKNLGVEDSAYLNLPVKMSDHDLIPENDKAAMDLLNEMAKKDDPLESLLETVKDDPLLNLLESLNEENPPEKLDGEMNLDKWEVLPEKSSPQKPGSAESNVVVASAEIMPFEKLDGGFCLEDLLEQDDSELLDSSKVPSRDASGTKLSQATLETSDKKKDDSRQLSQNDKKTVSQAKPERKQHTGKLACYQNDKNSVTRKRRKRPVRRHPGKRLPEEAEFSSSESSSEDSSDSDSDDSEIDVVGSPSVSVDSPLHPETFSNIIKGKTLWDTPLLYSPCKSPKIDAKDIAFKATPDKNNLDEFLDIPFSSIPDLLSPNRHRKEKFLHSEPIELSPNTVSSILSPNKSKTPKRTSKGLKSSLVTSPKESPPPSTVRRKRAKSLFSTPKRSLPKAPNYLNNPTRKSSVAMNAKGTSPRRVPNSRRKKFASKGTKGDTPSRSSRNPLPLKPNRRAKSNVNNMRVNLAAAHLYPSQSSDFDTSKIAQRMDTKNRLKMKISLREGRSPKVVSSSIENNELIGTPSGTKPKFPPTRDPNNSGDESDAHSSTTESSTSSSSDDDIPLSGSISLEQFNQLKCMRLTGNAGPTLPHPLTPYTLNSKVSSMTNKQITKEFNNIRADTSISSKPALSEQLPPKFESVEGTRTQASAGDSSSTGPDQSNEDSLINKSASSTEDGREWRGRDAKAKAQVLMADQHTIIKDFTKEMVKVTSKKSPNKINIRPLSQLLGDEPPASTTNYALDSPSTPEFLAGFKVPDKSKPNRLSHSTPNRRTSKTPFKNKDIRNYFAPKKSSSVIMSQEQDEASNSSNLMLEKLFGESDSSEFEGFAQPPNHPRSGLQKRKRSKKDSPPTGKQKPKAKDLDHQCIDIRQYLSPENKRQAKPDQDSPRKRRCTRPIISASKLRKMHEEGFEIEASSFEPYPREADFEGFAADSDDSESGKVGLKKRALDRIVYILRMIFPSTLLANDFPPDFFYDWDEEELNRKIFEKYD